MTRRQMEQIECAAAVLFAAVVYAVGAFFGLMN